MNNLTYKITIHGIVQGVGFRPYIYNLAKDFNLCGYVTNTNQGVIITLNINKNKLQKFIDKIIKNCPPLAHIVDIKYEIIDDKNFHDFVILKSKNTDGITFVSPDTSICKDCEEELLNENDKRFLHPFINCTNCGPRYSIIKNIPYDRKMTTMSEFKMCKSCEEEYNNPENRRFHAQPVCCNDCGPQVYSNNLKEIDAVKFIASKINEGEIVAVKGLGGYHLICDATDSKPIEKLRKLKNRKSKPLALMCSPGIIDNNRLCLNESEKNIINSPQSPIVLINKANLILSDLISPENNKIGIMKAYTPLHILLLKYTNTDFIVATSGNLKDEPIVTDNKQAEEKLSLFTNYFLHHNRKIHNGIDDSVATIVNKKIYILRRARGFAPYPVMLPEKIDKNVVGLGAHLKNTICLQTQNYAFVSQYIGDLDNFETTEFYNKTYVKLCNLFKIKPDILICDYHNGYYSSEFAEKSGLDIFKIQHHQAHLFSCMAENGLKNNVIGVVFDGTGLGDDGAIWGSEFFSVKNNVKREFHLQYVNQPGGDAAAKNPYTMMISYLIKFNLIDKIKDDLCKNFQIKKSEINLIEQMIEKGINSPKTSSFGRLFEATGSLLSGIKTNEFEGQTAIFLETMAENHNHPVDCYPFEIENDEIKIKGIIENIVKEYIENFNKNKIALEFHNTVTEIIKVCCLKIRKEKGLNDVVLSGGVFQNIFLLKKTISELEKNDFNVYTHSKVPANDGGISLGQVYGYILKNKKVLL